MCTKHGDLSAAVLESQNIIDDWLASNKPNVTVSEQDARTTNISLSGSSNSVFTKAPSPTGQSALALSIGDDSTTQENQETTARTDKEVLTAEAEVWKQDLNHNLPKIKYGSRACMEVRSLLSTYINRIYIYIYIYIYISFHVRGRAADLDAKACNGIGITNTLESLKVV